MLRKKPNVQAPGFFFENIGDSLVVELSFVSASADISACTVRSESQVGIRGFAPDDQYRLTHIHRDDPKSLVAVGDKFIVERSGPLGVVKQVIVFEYKIVFVPKTVYNIQLHTRDSGVVYRGMIEFCPFPDNLEGFP